MPTNQPVRCLSRRTFLRLSVAAGAGAALAACGSAPAASPSAPAATSAAPSGAGSAAPAGAPSAAASAKPSAAASGKPSAGTLKVASTSMAGSQTPMWLAENLKAFAQYGVTVSRQVVSADAGVKALISKEIDVLFQATPALMVADLNGNLDLVYVASIYNFAQFSMAVDPKVIQNAADLKGKIVGTGTPGSAVDMMCRTLLTKLGLKPSDVTLRAFGSSQGIDAALVAGQIPAGSISVPGTFQMETRGIKMLTNNYDIPYQNIGPIVSRARVQELSPLLLPFLQAMRDGIKAFSAQPDLAKQLISENTKETDQAILQKTYDFYIKEAHFQPDLEPTMPGIKAALDFLVDTIPSAKDAKPEQYVDRTILEKLPKG
jgi:taurine transport system substrate-binding protein